MAYGIHEARRKLRQLGGDLVKLPPVREIPPNGRGYWLGQYRVELPGREPRQVCEHLARMASQPVPLQELIQSMKPQENKP
jgi:hypothetical protein